MNDAEIKAGFENVLDRMVKAGWLLSYTYTDGKGFHLNWVDQGIEHSVALKKIITTFGLNHDDRAAIAFDKLCNGESFSGFSVAGQLNADIAKCWNDCVKTLDIRGNEDGLLWMVHIILGWAPDENNEVRFLKS